MSTIFNELNNDFADIKRKEEETAGKSTDRPTESKKEKTLIEELEENKEEIEVRKLVRQGVDFYEDQVDRLNKIKYELRVKRKQKVTIGRLVREAVDMYLEKLERKV